MLATMLSGSSTDDTAHIEQALADYLESTT